ncbi:MAG: methyltransferase domain-containing protein [Endomicrobiales bacterium]|nr:methyltransferase domain-containing protein [Endomicrobiales bacterium]
MPITINDDRKLSKKEASDIAGGKELRIDLGCGVRKKEGYVGVDSKKLEGVDVVCSLEKGLPFETGSVDGIYSNFFIEHFPDTIFIFKEMYRICKNGALIELTLPYYQSFTQFKDPTHKAVIPPEMLRYFTDEKWYGSDYGIGTNFKVLKISYQYLPPFDFRGNFIFTPVLAVMRRFLWNVVHSIRVKLEVVK